MPGERFSVLYMRPGDPAPDSARARHRIGSLFREGMFHSRFDQLAAYLVEGQPWTLGLAAFFWLWLASKFPTAAGMRAWVQTQLDLIDQQRRSGMWRSGLAKSKTRNVLGRN